MTAEPPPNFHPPHWDAAGARPRFGVGRRVRVARAFPPGHVRTPWYVRGRAGVVERVVGHFPNPQELAYGRDGAPKLVLYRVRFAMSDLWAGVEPTAQFASEDTLDVEVYENWLEPFFDYSADPETEKARIEALIASGEAASGSTSGGPANAP